MATVNQINNLLKARGHDAEIVRGEGYYYFAGIDAGKISETGLYGWAMKTTPAVDFVAEFEKRRKEY